MDRTKLEADTPFRDLLQKSGVDLGIMAALSLFTNSKQSEHHKDFICPESQDWVGIAYKAEAHPFYVYLA